jgi:ATP/maltotriose-dependent transcriptional regulator MalT
MVEIFGREPELTLADAFLESAGERFGVLQFEGEPGIGKTTVWREIARRAEGRGFRVLACRPAEAEANLALSAVADLLEPVPSERFASRAGAQRRALEVALLRVESEAAPPDLRTVAAAVRSLLEDLSSERPLLVAVDDVQWLDATSATVLVFALRRLTDDRVGWLLARRLGASARLDAEALVPPESVTVKTLGPLTPGALHRMLGERLDEPLPRPTLVRIHRASRGNPLFALEIAHELEAGAPPPPGARLPVPHRLREFLAGRIRTLPRDAQEALLAAAALSHPTAELVESVSCAAGLASAEEAELVRIDDGRVVFAHPLYASAVYETAPTARRRDLHRRLAERVTDPLERARHLAVATTDPDPAVAGMLEESAALARSRGAWDSAAELLEQACALTPSAGRADVWRRGVSAAEHHSRAGDRSRARALLEEILDEPLPGALRADALRLLAEVSYYEDKPAEARRLFIEALVYVEDPRLTVRIELGLSYLSAYFADFPGGVEHAYQALKSAEVIEDRALVGVALAYCAMYDYLSGQGVDWDKVERSLVLEDLDSVLPPGWHPSAIAALLLLYVGRHSEARERLKGVWATASERGDESDLAFILLWLSWLEMRSGNFAEAAALAEQADSFAVLTGSESMHAVVIAQRALVHAHRGEAAETQGACAEAAALFERLGDIWISVWIAASVALLELSRGRADAAWEACEPLTVVLEHQGIAEPVPAFFLPDAIEALIAVGRLERAEALIDALEGRGRELERPWALATGGRCRGLLLAARGDITGAAAALERAATAHERLEMPFELARTLLVTGVVERRARRRARAKKSFEQAFEIFDRLGAKLWAERAQQELGRVGLRRASGNELTAGERRVAELAARGLTNRQVAAALFISPKTVEANLTRIYRKLGIGSRAELGARMATARKGRETPDVTLPASPTVAT